jgi:hypothetical protein
MKHDAIVVMVKGRTKMPLGIKNSNNITFPKPTKKKMHVGLGFSNVL